MPPPARVTLLVVALVIALAAWPSWASAELTLIGATLNGATSVSTPPGGRVADDHADTRLIGQGVLDVQVPPAVTG